MASKVQVPQPPLTPIIGNLRSIDSGAGIQSLMRLATEYGPFFKLKILDREFYVASSQALVDELSDETRFRKKLHNSLKSVRAFAGDGLFTAYGDEPNWAKAHRLLMPAFGPIAIRGMFDRMLDVADQMLVRWERFGPDVAIDVSDNMTRLTLDTIALCAFSTRFNSFYQNEMHPFVDAMVRALTETGNRGRRPQVVNSLLRAKTRQFEADQALMRDVAQQLIADRRRDRATANHRDLLATMLDGVDPVTGEKLSDENIGFQLVTFLIAGHETTSGLLSFATYLLLKNPEVLAKARSIVDEVLGDEMPREEHLPQLRYIEQVLMEALRVWPTAPAYALEALDDTTIGGKYPLTPDDMVLVLVPSLHRDPAVWGDDPEAFRPERFAPEHAEKLPPNAWKPFGSGARACIGRPFAMQEALLVLTMMLQRFDLVLDDPSYQLKIHETLTIKPDGLRIRARARRDSDRIARTSMPPTPQQPLTRRRVVPHEGPPTPLLVLHGGNTGSSEAFAARIVDDAVANGFAATLATLDAFAGRLPQDGAVVVVTASYEGQPPDNARQFVAWVEGLHAGDLDGRPFAVFGCGNRQWARTYQAIPKRIDAALAAAGAERLAERGEADSGGDFFGAFDEWYGGLWPVLGTAFGKAVTDAAEAAPLTVEDVRDGRETTLRLGEQRRATVVSSTELVDMAAPGARSKRHVDIALPEGMTYRSGDYLAVLARNPEETVRRALRRLGLMRDSGVVLRRPVSNGLPLDRPIGVGELLESYVELNQPATRLQVVALAAAAQCPPERAELERLAAEEYDDAVLASRLSVLDLLERFQTVAIDLAGFLPMLPSMRARQYSISSSPLWRADHATLTVAVVDAPALSGTGRFMGIASTHLAAAQPGDRISVAVRPSNAGFHPPADPAVPVVLICAGSGIAPFRGFIQERAAQKAAGRDVGEALLFFGIDAPDVDFLYRDEFAAWERVGVVTVLPAFSEAPERGVRFVQDRVWEERSRIVALFGQDAVFYLCGDGRRMAPAVRKVLIAIYREATEADAPAAEVWADEMEHERGRFVSDVFA